MMILRSSPSSPFGRKVRIAVSLLGFDGDVKIEPADTTDVNDSVRAAKSARQNSGADRRGRRRLLRFPGDPRLSRRPRGRRQDRAARGEGAACGASPAGAVRRHSRCVDPDHLRNALAQGGAHEPKWLEHQAGKVARGLAALEAAPPPLDAGLPNVGQITLACVLGYRDFRFGGSWRGDHPRLVAWLDNFAARVPAFAATKPTG